MKMAFMTIQIMGNRPKQNPSSVELRATPTGIP
jgi:hypothetical protein